MLAIVDTINWVCQGFSQTMIMAQATYSSAHDAQTLFPPRLGRTQTDCWSKTNISACAIPSGSSQSRELLPITRFVANNMSGAEVSMLAAAVYSMLDFR